MVEAALRKGRNSKRETQAGRRNSSSRSGVSSSLTPFLIITAAVSIGIFSAVHSPIPIHTCQQIQLSIISAEWNQSNLTAIIENSGHKPANRLTAATKPPSGRFGSERSLDTPVHPGNATSVTLDVAGPVKTIKIRAEQCPHPLATHQPNNTCPPGLALIDVSKINQSTVDTTDMNDFCIFKYEASRRDATPSHEGNSTTASSQQGVVPWRNIVQDSEEGIAVNTYYPPSVEPPTVGAKQACQNAGYELVTNKQWQAATMAERGQPETWVHGNTNWGKYGNTDWDDAGNGLNETCTDDPTHSRLRNGSMEEKAICLTGTGPHDTWCTEQGVCDLVGNVAEWTSDFYGKGHECDIVNMESVNYSCNYQEQSHFSTYYIDSWDAEHACPASVSLCREPDFNNDYYTPPDDPPDGAVIRGGAWGHTVWGGPWTTVLYIPPSGWAHDIGFRCAFG